MHLCLYNAVFFLVLSPICVWQIWIDERILCLKDEVLGGGGGGGGVAAHTKLCQSHRIKHSIAEVDKMRYQSNMNRN